MTSHLDGNRKKKQRQDHWNIIIVLFNNHEDLHLNICNIFQTSSTTNLFSYTVELYHSVFQQIHSLIMKSHI